MNLVRLLIMMFMGMIGTAILIHYRGQFTLQAIISDIIGIILIAVLVISFLLYMRQKSRYNKQNREGL